MHTKQEVGDEGKIFSIHSCMFCKNYQQKLLRKEAEKPRVKINRFAEHFIEDCLNCPESVKDECLKKCKSKRMKSFKKVREAEEIKNQQLQAAEYARKILSCNWQRGGREN